MRPALGGNTLEEPEGPWDACGLARLLAALRAGCHDEDNGTMARGARGERGGHTSADLRRRMIWPTSDAEGLNRRHKNTRKRIAPLAGTVSAYDVMHHIHIDSDVVGGIRRD